MNFEDRDHLDIPATLPLLPVRDLVVFPYMIVPLFVSRDISIAAVEDTLHSHRMLLLAAQREADQDAPGAEDVYKVGTVGMVMRMRRLVDGRLKVLVQGLVRGRIHRLGSVRPHLTVAVRSIHDLPLEEISLETEALMRTLRENLERYSKFSSRLEADVLGVLQGLRDPGRLADLVASHLIQPVPEAQKVLETPDPVKRLRLVADQLAKELELMSTKSRIEVETRERLGKSQREFFLREQMKQIQTELGGGEGDDETRELRTRIGESDMPVEVCREAEKQLQRLARMHAESAEAGTIRTYLEWLLDLKWQHATEDRLDLSRAKKLLDHDHLGLEEAKDRILESLGVRKLNPETPGSILLLVGPPGVGKTSLGRSIARAMNRAFVRVSLGGVQDDAEIRGHRRTYVGALPGRIIQGMKQARSVNPVFMLDEIDKLGGHVRGNPTAALLEVLDPEQNGAFVDHYLHVPYNLSRVMFITTANRVDTIAPALLDRMEEIRLPGYTLDEKEAIVVRHLMPKQMARCGLQEHQLSISAAALRTIIERHTREAGLRQLERAVSQICRKKARRVAEGDGSALVLEAQDVPTYLGPPLHMPIERLAEDAVGVVNGLAWTPAGGEIMQVEAVRMAGSGRLILTGQLGDVMKESAQAALSFARSRALRMGLGSDFFSRHDIHIHVPAGSIPKDGPSAGVAMAVALASLLLEVPVRRGVAMTGEISLSGRLLPVGGIRDKLLAALWAGVEQVLVPRQNRAELDLMGAELRGHLAILEAATIEEALGHALRKTPWRGGAPRPSLGEAKKTGTASDGAPMTA